jgi:hypothetical protein
MLTEDNVRQGYFELEEFEDVREALPARLRGVGYVRLSNWDGASPPRS